MNDKILAYKDLISGQDNYLSKLANTTAYIKSIMPKASWVGFYLYEKGSDCLYLGPFQGDVACYTIPNGKGVCGQCMSQRKTLIVDDVTKFAGYISCSNTVKSEIVLPMRNDIFIIGVLDIDSDELNAFTKDDECLLNDILEILLASEFC
jgi:L-methionine (R)-S-oxide reductase